MEMLDEVETSHSKSRKPPIEDKRKSNTGAFQGVMTTSTVTKRLREEATCSKCQQLMTDPMIIDCGHSFCHECLINIMDQHKKIVMGKRDEMIYFCEFCNTAFKEQSIRPNKKLKTIIETIKEINSEKLCEEHGEMLHFFCEDDDELICLYCERKPQHRGHTTVLVEDVCQEYKEKLQKAVTKLRENDLKCKTVKLSIQMQRKKWKEMVSLQTQKIHSDFNDLHRFLNIEINHYLWSLMEEDRKTQRILQENEDMIEKQSKKLQTQILELEKKCQDSIQNLMQDVKQTLSRNSAVKLEFPKAVSLDLHTKCNASELFFYVRKVLKRYQVSVTLDPETAHNNLFVSEDGKKVTGGYAQKKPQSSKRFTLMPCVLGCEVLTSQRCYFEVDVGDQKNICDIGVCLLSVQRNIKGNLQPHRGFWAIQVHNGNGIYALTSPRTPIFQDKPSIVGVFVDYEAGLVSFYNVKMGCHIFTFPKASFTHSLLPLFQVYKSSSLTLCPTDL
ncbi:E3 ubiquitin-protein ligase TRIM38-like isoform X1 [Suncus etruscus]|uniref:E3 ubiquitin-protein ligase TRIM38-like isoform X1 n=1 Tax=Suncus etruscus TaxID=109475 RepID=UPI0021101003|nr:E3 ubiquitin-protein ligase TRIM38-like isoform X1 [Suncus etruscus]